MPFSEADCRRCRRDFPALERTLDGRPLAYLDGPAGTQVPRQVIDAVSGYYRRRNANTHGRFPTSAETERELREARRAGADFLGAPDWRCISFGHNMTTLTFSLSQALAREMEPGDEILVTELDHEANRGPWLDLRERGIEVREAALRRDGRLDLEDLAAKIGPRTRLAAVGLASNALGTVNDLVRIGELTRAAGARLLVDAVHYAAHLPVDVATLDPDFLLCSAYKFYGPHIGILYTRPGLLERLATDRLRTQEPEAPYRIETGTLNHAAIAGTRAAIEYLASWGSGADSRARIVDAMGAIAAYEHELGRLYCERVAGIPGVTVWGPGFDDGERCPTVSVSFDRLTAREVAERLGAEGIQVWDGDFYAARCVEVLGLAERGGLLRVGVAMYNTREEIERLLEALERIVTEG